MRAAIPSAIGNERGSSAVCYTRGETGNRPANAYTDLSIENAALGDENAALKEKLASVELDRGMLRLELGSVS